MHCLIKVAVFVGIMQLTHSAWQLCRWQYLLHLCRFWGGTFCYWHVGGSFCWNYAGDCFCCNYAIKSFCSTYAGASFCSKYVGDNFYCNYAQGSLCFNYAGGIFCSGLGTWQFLEIEFYCNYVGDSFLTAMKVTESNNFILLSLTDSLFIKLTRKH